MFCFGAPARLSVGFFDPVAFVCCDSVCDSVLQNTSELSHLQESQVYGESCSFDSAKPSEGTVGPAVLVVV